MSRWQEPPQGVLRVYANNTGLIKELLVREGEVVKEDQPLLIIHGNNLLANGDGMENQLLQELEKLTEESIAARAKENSYFMESVRAIQTIKIFHRESDQQHYRQNYLAEAMNKDIRNATGNIR